MAFNLDSPSPSGQTLVWCPGVMPNPNLDRHIELPDVSVSAKADHVGPLSQVGMRQIEMPILIKLPNKVEACLPARIDAFVSLDRPDTKGIHMSRLYRELRDRMRTESFGPAVLKHVLERFLASHEGLSERSYIRVNFELPVERHALLSGEIGFRHYPVQVEARIAEGVFRFVIGVEVLYSSTCPCSAALSRQLMRENFLENFGDKKSLTPSEVADWLNDEASLNAVPHSQRSRARVNIVLSDRVAAPSPLELIDRLEAALGTPVQAAVKRVDEQEFARLNAENLMFCEDAARKIRQVLETDSHIADYDIYVEHQESLHPHDAVCRVVKGVPGGFAV